MSDEQVHEDIINSDNPISATEQIGEPQGTVQQSDTESKIPEKFRGKSAEDLVEMYTNLEQDHSRLGNEVGQNRKLIDQLLQSQAEKHVSTEEELDWDYDTEKAASQLVEKEVGAVKQELNEIKQAQALKDFKDRFPSYDTDANTAEFREWANGSDYRKSLLNKNINGIDFAAASELMQGWEDYKGSINTQENTTEQKRQQDLKAAAMEKGASSGAGRKKIWSRAYIRDIMINDKATYKAHYDEIMAAYAEGRLTK